MTRQSHRVPCARSAISLCVLAFLAACGGDGGDDHPAVTIQTVNNRADQVSDGDALIEIVLPSGTTAGELKVDVDGRDVTSAFAARADGRILGVVSGLRVGANVVSASTRDAAAASLTVTNAERGGPVHSGAQVTPYFCATPVPQGATAATPATNGSGLGTAASDAKCNIATEVKLYYRTTAANCSLALPDPLLNSNYLATAPATTAAPPSNPCFKPYTAGAAAPADLATTTTDAGVTVPYIVRVERGTMNRGIYDIAVLYDPTKPAFTGATPQPQWNGKVYYLFGASTGQPRRQIRPATPWTDDRALGRGWIVATNSMTDSARNSNRVLMSETVMMMKEHIGDTYGRIKFTFGTGCSGGSINSNMNASINPGLLDGIATSCTYPDSETTSLEVGDCVLLVEAYQKTPWRALMTAAGYTSAQIDAKKAAINGHVDQTACHGWYNAFGTNGRAGLFNTRTVAVNGTITVGAQTNNCELPPALVYDPANPTATANLARCNAWSWAQSIWGKAPNTQAANDTRDNVGVQYGLRALQAGTITAEEFVTLNESVGGIDRDSTPTAARSVADNDALSIAYRAGIVMSGKQLAQTAVIDMRGWDDSQLNLPPGVTSPPLAIHHQWYSFGIRDRLVAEAGDAGNQALWRFARNGLTPSAAMQNDAFLLMDQWLTTLKADTSSAALAAKVRTARPAATADYCLLSTDAAQATKVTNAATCNADTYLKPSLSPRQVAGGPRAENVLKCQLKPLAQTDYATGTFTATQFARLQAVFSGGVCDWTKPGVSQLVATSPLNFAAGPGGQPFAAAPVSARK